MSLRHPVPTPPLNYRATPVLSISVEAFAGRIGANNDIVRDTLGLSTGSRKRRLVLLLLRF